MSSLKLPSTANVVSKPSWSQNKFSSSASARIFSSAWPACFTISASVASLMALIRNVTMSACCTFAMCDECCAKQL